MTETINKFNNSRTYHLRGAVTDETVDQIVKNILAHNNEDEGKDYHSREPIHLSIETYGGGVNEGLSLVSTILSSQTPVYTYCRGRAMSMGFILFVAGHQRFMARFATLMFHSASATYGGKMETIEKNLEQGQKLTRALMKITTETTNIPEDKLEHYLERKEEWYIDSEEALKYGMTDIILDEFRTRNREDHEKPQPPQKVVEEKSKKVKNLEGDEDLTFVKKLGEE